MNGEAKLISECTLVLGYYNRVVVVETQCCEVEGVNGSLTVLSSVFSD